MNLLILLNLLNDSMNLRLNLDSLHRMFARAMALIKWWYLSELQQNYSLEAPEQSISFNFSKLVITETLV